MDDAIFPLHFPNGQMPARGFRCSTCGHERLSGSEFERLEKMARELGLYGIEESRERKLLKVGNSLVVTIDPALARMALGTSRPGIKVRVGLQGKRIIIEAASHEGKA